jgi:rare lipoprotein A
MRKFTSLAVVLTLAACGGPGPRPTPEPSATRPGTIKPPAYVLKRGGGFYQDDGPGDTIPDNLDSIPDAVPRIEPPHRYANRPYSVLGRDYEPLRPGAPYRATGVASWYGRKFHGQKTSVGETYDMYAMTAAHPTLSIPSYARVTNPANGKSVIVRVNDRGPFLHSRVIDLSYAAAWKLGYVGSGSTQVIVESVMPGRDSAPPPTAPPEDDPLLSRIAMADQPEGRRTPRSGGPEQGEGWSEAPRSSPQSLPEITDARGIYLQLGAFSNADNAEMLRGRLARELGNLGDRLAVQPGGGMYRLHLGPYANRDEAHRVADQLAELLDFRPVVVQR